jgi:competence protein ComEC
MDKPMVSVCLLYLAGVIAASFIPLSCLIPLIGISVTLLAGSLFYILKSFKLSNISLVASIFLLGWLRYSMITQVQDPYDISRFADGGYAQVMGTVIREPDVRDGRVFLTLRAESVDLKRASGLLRVSVRVKKTEASYGDRVIAQGILRLPSGMRNPGEFDYREHLKRQGIYAVMDVRGDRFITVIGRGRMNYLVGFALSVKAVMVKAIDKYIYDGMEAGLPSFLRAWAGSNGLPASGRGILKGILLGDVSEMPPQVQDMFTSTGTVHVLVVSGSNVALVVAIFYWILRRLFGVRTKPTAVASMGFILVYLFITGAQPPVLRASIMAIVALVAILLERDGDVYNILAISGFAILVWNPLMLYDPSFQLSVSALLGVVYLTPLIERWFRPLGGHVPGPLGKFLRGIVTLFSASLGAQLATTPIIVYYFNRASIIALAANLFVVPLAGFILPLGAALAIIGSVGLVGGPIGLAFGYIAQALGYVSWGLVNLTVMVVRLFAEVPYASVPVPTPDVLMIITYCFAVIIILNLGPSRWAKKGLVFGSLALVSLWVWVKVLTPDNLLSVTYLDVGQGDSAFIRFPDGSNMLIDGGGSLGSKYDVGERVVNPFLLRHWALTIDRMVVSHPDADHLMGLLAVLKNRRVREVIDIGASHPSFAYRDFLRLVLAEGIGQDGYRTPYCGMVLRKGKGWEATVLYPEVQGGEFPKANNNSIVVKITYGDVTFLFVGDIESEAEEELVSTLGGEIDVDILKVPHHGSSTSSSPIFLEATTPEVAVISVGRGNFYGHPAPEVMERYKSYGIDVYRTDEDGAVAVVTDGHSFRVETARRD